MAICIICKERDVSRREYCARCYSKGLYNGTISRLQKPELPKSLSQNQVDILVGSMLGDGNLSKHAGDARLNIIRKADDLEYLKWEFESFKDFCMTGIRYREVFDQRYNNTYFRVSFHTRNSPLFTSFYVNWYPNKKKIVPQNIELTPLALAVWLCDDGSVISSYKPFRLNLQLCTNGFTVSDTNFLISLLEKRYNEHFRLCIDKKGNPIIHAGDNATRAFLYEIDDFIPVSMYRKAVKWRSDEHQFYTNKPRRTYYRHWDSVKLPGSELSILSYVKNNIDTTSAQLLGLGMKKSRISILLQKLTNLGYLIVTKQSPNNGGYKYNISDKGMETIGATNG